MTYEEIREIVINKCIEQEACLSELTKLKSTKTEIEFWDVLKINALWANKQGVLSIELLKKYDAKKLKDNNIFIAHEKVELAANVFSINYNGTVIYNSGTITYNSGTVIENSGTVIYNSGTITYNSGTITNNSGTVTENYGTVICNYSAVTYNYSVINSNYSVVTSNYSAVTDNSGTITYNSGTITNNSGTVIENSGTVTENSGAGVIIERQSKLIYIKNGHFKIIYI